MSTVIRVSTVFKMFKCFSCFFSCSWCSNSFSAGLFAPVFSRGVLGVVSCFFGVFLGVFVGAFVLCSFLRLCSFLKLCWRASAEGLRHLHKVSRSKCFLGGRSAFFGGGEGTGGEGVEVLFSGLRGGRCFLGGRGALSGRTDGALTNRSGGHLPPRMASETQQETATTRADGHARILALARARSLKNTRASVDQRPPHWQEHGVRRARGKFAPSFVWLEEDRHWSLAGECHHNAEPRLLQCPPPVVLRHGEVTHRPRIVHVHDPDHAP